MSLKVEIAVSQMNKAGEELCGDVVELAKGESTVIVLSDGLGSGVKAHILSSLTAKMAATMLTGGIPLDEVIECFAKTLPVDEVRNLAYSTFTILSVDSQNRAHLVEYDNPPVFCGRGNFLRQLTREKKEYSGRTVYESSFDLQDGDWLVMVSDGVLHAGIGGVWNLGWGWDRVADYLKRVAPHEEDAHSLALGLEETTRKLYAGSPGDDVSIVAVKVRHPRLLTVLTGPPMKRRDDKAIVREFMSYPGKKAVCGGTTSIMLAREIGKEVNVNLGSLGSGAPPTGRIEGVDLVTEGILTLSKAAEILGNGYRPTRHQFRYASDGPGRLVDMLLEADHIRFMVGRAINPAHQSPSLPMSLSLQSKVVEDLAKALRSFGKRVDLRLF